MAEPVDQPNPADAVAVAYVHQDDVTYSFHHSMVALLDHDMSASGRVWTGGYTTIRGGTDGLAHARNEAVKGFLTDKRADWLWWVDTDMGFTPDTVDRLFEAADPHDRPVMGGLCFANYEVDNDGMGGRRALAAPVIMHWAHNGDEAGFDVRWDYPMDTVVRCDGIGSACVLVHRSVFEKVKDKYGEHWYSRARNPSTGVLISEDLSFCARLMALQVPVHVHTGVRTTHAKRIWLSEEDYWGQRALNGARGFGPPTKPVPPATDVVANRAWTVPRYAIIPTHNRPARLLSLIVSLGTQVDTIVVLDNASNPAVDQEKLQASVPGRVTVEVIRDEEQPPHLSRYWNVMLDRCADLAKERGEDEYDVGVFNDDAVLPGGWFNAVSTGLRAGPAVVAHTDPTTPPLMTDLSNEPGNRMCPHAFVTRGEAGMRADEDMRWWYFDSDFDQRARQSGGVLSVPGPRVANANANSTTVGPLAEQAHKDMATFAAKWSNR